jgi:hypothetical protein
MSAIESNNRERMPRRVLAVVDWRVGPSAVADALQVSVKDEPTYFGLLVPARLPGLDWIGDPNASCPCAERQLQELERVFGGRGMAIERAMVGQPERVPAIRAMLESWPADGVVLFDRGHVFPTHFLSVPRRVERATGHAVTRVSLPSARMGVRRFPRRGPRCATA